MEQGSVECVTMGPTKALDNPRKKHIPVQAKSPSACVGDLGSGLAAVYQPKSPTAKTATHFAMTVSKLTRNVGMRVNNQKG